jgi:hypothetical protein
MAKNGKNRPNLLPNQVLYQAELRSDLFLYHDAPLLDGSKQFRSNDTVPFRHFLLRRHCKLFDLLKDSRR